MKVTLATLFLVLVIRTEALKCVQGDNGAATATVCSDETETKCSQPKFVEYTGMAADQKYACGGCAANTAAKCEECTTDGCNKAKETAADFKCYSWQWKTGGDKELWEQKTVETCKRLKDTKIMCNMPGEKADKTYTLAGNGCGPCDTAAKSAGKCVECDSEECNEQPILCVQGDGKDLKGKPCKPTMGAVAGKAVPKKCHQPKFTEYTGFATGQNYGCGECPKDSEAKCQSCDGKKDDACNKKIETGADFKCYDYELKSDKHVQKKEAGVCKRLKTTTAIKCNMPGLKADKTYKVKNMGCGPCSEEDKKAEKCVECDKDSCNKSGAATIAALTMSMLATLYILL